MIVIGICAGGHDSSAALLIDGKVEFAISEERLDRIKHSRAFPWKSIQACLDFKSLTIGDVDCISLGWNFKRFVNELYLKPALADISHFKYLHRDIDKLNDFLNYEPLIRDRLGYSGDIKHCNHHDCHIAYAFHTSDFDEANFLSMDGYGEIETTVLGHIGKDNVAVIDQQAFPNSLGLAYAALTHYLGFKHHCDEGIVMGLASYGDASEVIPGLDISYASVFDRIIQFTDNFNFKVSEEWLAIGMMKGEWVRPKFTDTFGPIREPDSDLTKHHMNIAAAIQDRIEQVGIQLASNLRKKSPSKNLCLSGGLALNCVMNTKIYEQCGYDNVYIPSAPADNGNSIGACILAHLERAPHVEIEPLTQVIGLGPIYGEDEIENAIQVSGVEAKKSPNVRKSVAGYLNEGKIVGFFNGRSEFGPRALGQRSILTRPFPAKMKDILNSRVKFREYFRPFAPVVLANRVSEYFALEIESPHMMHAVSVKPEKVEVIAATVHVDNTCRVQTVDSKTHADFYNLIEEFEKLSGIPVILNTSFNVKGQPIVETPTEAIDCFLSTNIDVLALGDYILTK